MLDVDWDVHDVGGPAGGDDDGIHHGFGDVTDERSGEDAVALVAAVVANGTPVARRVRLTARADGSVHPPRRRGVPEAGWSEDGFDGVVPAGGRRALGFAVGGPVADPPVEVTDRGRVAGDARGDGTVGRDGRSGEPLEPGAVGDAEPTPTDLLRELGSPAPPRDAVPAPEADAAASESVPGAGVPPDRRSS